METDRTSPTWITAVLLLCLWLAGFCAHAATIPVTGSGDSSFVNGLVDLREAVASINAGAARRHPAFRRTGYYAAHESGSPCRTALPIHRKYLA
ncbi:MAG: hypothetical protein ABI831_26260 [Betaproteobacteria bacterium]